MSKLYRVKAPGLAKGLLLSFAFLTLSFTSKAEHYSRSYFKDFVKKVQQKIADDIRQAEQLITGKMAAEDFVCTVSVQNIKVSGCYYTGGQSKATVSAEIHWIDVPSGGTITVTLGSQVRSVRTGTFSVAYSDGSTGNQTIVSPQIVAFEVDADGSGGTISAVYSLTCQGSAGFTAPSACPPVVCNTDGLGGTVYKDFNANGAQDGGESIGLDNIAVTGYTAGGGVHTTTTDVFGKWVLNIPSDEYPVRVEFSNLTAEYGKGSVVGTNNATTTQFYSTSSCTADLGLLEPSTFCQANPFLAVPCYISGDPTNGSVSSLDALVGFPYTASGLKNPALSFKIATAGQIGATWGVAYNKFTKKIFAAAVLKRHAGFAAGGLGGIYVIGAGNLPAGPPAPTYIDVVADLGVDVGATAVGSNSARGITGAEGDGLFFPGAVERLEAVVVRQRALRDLLQHCPVGRARGQRHQRRHHARIGRSAAGEALAQGFDHRSGVAEEHARRLLVDERQELAEER